MARGSGKGRRNKNRDERGEQRRGQVEERRSRTRTNARRGREGYHIRTNCKMISNFDKSYLASIAELIQEIHSFIEHRPNLPEWYLRRRLSINCNRNCSMEYSCSNSKSYDPKETNTKKQ